MMDVAIAIVVLISGVALAVFSVWKVQRRWLSGLTTLAAAILIIPSASYLGILYMLYDIEAATRLFVAFAVLASVGAIVTAYFAGERIVNEAESRKQTPKGSEEE